MVFVLKVAIDSPLGTLSIAGLKKTRNPKEGVMSETVATHSYKVRSRLQDCQTDMPQTSIQTTSEMAHLNGTRKWTGLLQLWKKGQ